MKIIFYLLLPFALWSWQPLQAQQCTGNLLQNSGFENGVAAWEGSPVLSTGGANGSAYALRQCANSSSSRQTVRVNAGQLYELRYWARGDAGAKGGVLLKFLSSAWTPLEYKYEDIVFVNSTQFTSFTQRRTAPAGAAWVEVSLVKESGPGCVYADDFCLSAVVANTLPDLQLENIILDKQTVAANDIVTCSVEVVNKGGTAAEAFYVYGYVSNDGVRSPEDYLVLNGWIETLQPGERRKLTVSFEPGRTEGYATAGGAKQLLFLADGESYINESNEQNNNVEVPFTILPLVPPSNCTTPLGDGKILCHQKTTNNTWEVYTVDAGKNILRLELDAEAQLVSGNNAGRLVEDSLLVKNNQLVKKLANGTVQWTKNIPAFVKNKLPVIELVRELPDGSIVWGGFQKKIVSPATFDPGNVDSLVMIKTNASVTALLASKVVLSNSGAVVYDRMLYLFPLTSNELVVMTQSGIEQGITNYFINTFKLDFSFISVPTGIGQSINLNASSVVKTPCGTLKLEGEARNYGGKSFSVSQTQALFEPVTMSFNEQFIQTTGSIDYFGGYQSYTLNNQTPGAVADAGFIYKRYADPLVNLRINLPQPGGAVDSIVVPFVAASRVIRTGSQSVLLLGENSGTWAYNPECNNKLKLPDLEITALELSTSSIEKGKVLPFKIDVRNNSAVPVNSNFTIKSYLSKDPVLSADDYQNGTIPTGNFGPGQIILQVQGAMLIQSSVLPGDYFVIVKIDADDQIQEIKEFNNTLVSATTVKVTSSNVLQPDLELTLNAEPPNPGQWSYTTFQLTVKNTGTAASNQVVVQFLDQSKSQVSSQLAYVSHKAPAGTAFNNWKGSWNVPTIAPGGSYTLEYKAFTKLKTEVVVFAQVTSASGTDVDSSPGNNAGNTPKEDDEARCSINYGPVGTRSDGSLAPVNPAERPNFTVYPNPAYGRVTADLSGFEADEKLQLLLVNAQGQILQEWQTVIAPTQVHRTLDLDLSAYPAGVYHLQVYVLPGMDGPVKHRSAGQTVLLQDAW